MQIIPWGTYYDKLTLALAYGGAPDVFIVHAARLPEFASFGALRPLADRYAERKPAFQPSDFAPVPWHASFYKGVQYALPLDTHPCGLYYNTKLFKDAGIVDAHGNAKPPTNLAEFLDDARKLTRDTDGGGRPDQWGFVFTNERTNWITIASQFGAEIVSPDGRRCTIDSPQSIAASQLMHDFIYKYHIAPMPEGIDSWLAFRQGKVGMAMEGIYMLDSLQEQTGLQFAGAPVPQFGPQQATWGGSHMLCQPAGLPEERSRVAWRLMTYISDHSLTWGEGGQVPARSAVRRSAAFQALPVQSQFARELPYVHYEPLIPKDNSIFQFVDPAIEAVLLDLQTPQQAMSDARRRVDQLLARS
jgi:multiple sugar transport system substrate-binding protein